ncbi:SUMF1/EgtB/PvdO family nonheme iron enzyme [bacterium]|nr:SUMF1/EgtB/PvdO family nonheme iron enzyme [bacterium]
MSLAEQIININQNSVLIMLKRLFSLLVLSSFLSVISVYADTAKWSAPFSFDGDEITEEAILLRPADPLSYSSVLANGEPKSLTVMVEDIFDHEKSAVIFADYSGQCIEGTVCWDYTGEEYKDFSLDDTYLLTETVTSDAELKEVTRKVTLVPEPAFLFLLGLAALFLLHKHLKRPLLFTVLLIFGVLDANAESSVTEVSCLQMWPFDRSVIINYTIESDAAVVFKVKFYGYDDAVGEVFDLEDRGTLYKDGADGMVSGVGKHKTIWTPDESFYGFKTDNMSVKVEIEENRLSQTFEYVIESDTESTLPVFAVQFYGRLKDGTVFRLEDAGFLFGDGASGITIDNGRHELVWMPRPAYTDLLGKLELNVEYEDITSKAKYLVLNLNTYKMRSELEGPMEDPNILSNDMCRTDELWLRRIEPGAFYMGSRSLEIGFAEDESKHKVGLTKAYYIGVFELTQKQFERINGSNSLLNEESTRPVDGVSYDSLRGAEKGSSWPAETDHRVDAGSFFAKLRYRAGNLFDLPTESQWEFACRAGSATSLNNEEKLEDKENDANLDKLGWYYYNSGDSNLDPQDENGLRLHPVGQKFPNAWGLYDMHGNVYEWCLDWYGEYPYESVKDPKGTESGEGRILRGGDIFHKASDCRSAARHYGKPNEFGSFGESSFGFRAAISSNYVKKDEGEPVRERFSYTIKSGTKNTLPVYKVKLYGKSNNGSKYLLEDIGKLEGDGATGFVVGKDEHNVIWIPDEAHKNLIGQLKIIVGYVDVTRKAKYLVFDLKKNKMRVSEDGPDVTDDKCRTDELWLRRIEPGVFFMGSLEKEKGRSSEERQHEVELVKAYYIGVFEFTQRQYEIVTGSNPSIHVGDKTRPVDCVSYKDLRGDREGATWPSETDHRVDDGSFFAKLRNKVGNIFDLPTEAQWEFACRGGATNAWNDGSDATGGYRDPNLDNLGWYNPKNPNDDHGDDYYGYSLHTNPVGQKQPNAWGLYDMHGNVKEWCLDWYVNYKGRSVEPVGAYSAYDRVLRGGDILNRADRCRSASRGYCRPNDDGYFYNFCLGFRVVITSNLVIEDKENIVKESFTYTVNSDTENTLPVFRVKFYGKANSGDEYPLEDIGRLENDGAAGLVFGEGEHSLTWFPTGDYTNLIGQLEIRVDCEDVTEQATYLVFDLPSNKMRVSADGPDLTNDLCRTDELWLRRIEPGTFTMGSPEDEFGRYQGSHMEDQHGVTLTKAYYIGIFETTQKQFELIAGYNPSEYSGAVRPVDFVSYDDLRGGRKGQNWPADRNVDDDSFFGLLRARAGNNFDLPTEAQWEFACRAGTNTSLNDGNNITNNYSDGCLNRLGRYWGNHNGNQGGYTYTAAVGSYLPNAWGLYDMHGNVMEWCLDWYRDYSEDVVDPKGSEYGDYRVLRGGSWESHAYTCRSAFRDFNYVPGHTYNYFGFRIVLVP